MDTRAINFYIFGFIWINFLNYIRYKADSLYLRSLGKQNQKKNYGLLIWVKNEMRPFHLQWYIYHFVLVVPSETLYCDLFLFLCIHKHRRGQSLHFAARADWHLVVTSAFVWPIAGKPPVENETLICFIHVYAYVSYISISFGWNTCNVLISWI